MPLRVPGLVARQLESCLVDLWAAVHGIVDAYDARVEERTLDDLVVGPLVAVFTAIRAFAPLEACESRAEVAEAQGVRRDSRKDLL